MLGIMKENIVTHVKDHLPLYLAVLFFFIIGIMAGVFTIAQMPAGQFYQISRFLDSFFAVLKTQAPNIGNVLVQSILNNFKLVMLIAFCGFTVFCMPVMLILMSVKGFMVGFTIAAMVSQFGFLGVMVSLLCIIPPNAIIVMSYLRLGVDASLNGVENYRLKKAFQGKHPKPRFDREYMNQVARVSLFCLAGVIIESVMAPFVLRIFAGAIAI